MGASGRIWRRKQAADLGEQKSSSVNRRVVSGHVDPRPQSFGGATVDLTCRGGCCHFVDGEVLTGCEFLGTPLLHGIDVFCGGEGSSPSTNVRKFSCQPISHFTSVRSHAHGLGFRVYTLDLVSHPPLTPVLLMFDWFRSSLKAHFLFVVQTKLIHSPTPRYTISALVVLAMFASFFAYVYPLKKPRKKPLKKHMKLLQMTRLVCYNGFSYRFRLHSFQSTTCHVILGF